MREKKLILVGRGASAGITRGKVQIVTSTKDTTRFEQGNIMVTRMTDPSMIMIMTRASAIVTDIGGTTSHPSIISRELGIPCVVATEKATQILEEGVYIEVNGETGEIFLVKERD